MCLNWTEGFGHFPVWVTEEGKGALYLCYLIVANTWLNRNSGLLFPFNYFSALVILSCIVRINVILGCDDLGNGSKYCGLNASRLQYRLCNSS